MGRIEDLESDEKAKATAAAAANNRQPAARHGVEWVPNEAPSAVPAPSDDGIKEPSTTAATLASSAQQQQAQQQQQNRRSTDEFVSDKRSHGAAAPVAERKPRDGTATTTANADGTTGTTSTTNGTDGRRSNMAVPPPQPSSSASGGGADPYSHLRSGGWRDQPRHRDEPIRPVEAEMAYEVVATPVFDKDEDDERNRNPFKDWRVLALIVIVAVIVGLAVGLVTSKNSNAAAAAANMAAGGVQGQPEGGGMGVGGVPTEQPVFPPLEVEDDGTDTEDDETAVAEEEEMPPPVVEEEEQPVAAPTLPPTPDPTPEPTDAPVVVAPPTQDEEDDNTSPTGGTGVAGGDDANDRPLPLAGCSKRGKPSVLLTDFYIYLTTTYPDAKNDVPGQVFVQVTFDHLWPYVQTMSGIYGFSLEYDLVENLRRQLEEEQYEDGRQQHQQQQQRRQRQRQQQQHSMLRKRRLQSGGDFETKLWGCIDLRDETVVPPSYNDVQDAIDSAFSGTNAATWLAAANAEGIEATSVKVLDATGAEIGSATP